MSNMILRITVGGSVVADLSTGLPNPKYDVAAAGWAPRVTARRRATLGGYGPYLDVAEEIPVMVYGTSPANCLANLAALSQALDAAEEWAAGKATAVVLLEYQPDGAAALLQAVILGRAGDEEAVVLPPTFHAELGQWIIDPVALRFVRRGLWLAASETLAATPAVANPSVHTMTFGSSQVIAGPLQLLVTFQNHIITVNPLLLLFADAATKIMLKHAHDFVHAGAWSDLADAAHLPASGNILRYTPAGTTFSSPGTLTLTPPADSRRFAIFATIRNNSGSVSWQVKSGLGGYNGNVWMPPIVVDTTTTSPRPFCLGVISVPSAPSNVLLSVAASSTAGGPTLDFDSFVVLALDNDCCGAVGITLDGNGVALPNPLYVMPQPLSAPQPAVYAYDPVGSNAYMQAYTGDAFRVTAGTVAAALALGTDKTNGYWTIATVGPATQTVTMTATRWPAYLTPQ